MSGEDFLKLNEQIRILRIQRRKDQNEDNWYLYKMYEDLIIKQIEASNDEQEMKEGMRYAYQEDLQLFYNEGFEFELKCADGWYKKKVTKIENLESVALIQLIADNRIRIFKTTRT